jgi:hypothetical protein
MTTQKIYQLPVEITEWKFDGATEIMFNWEYDDGSADLLNLYEKGKQQQWDTSTRIDWTQELDEGNPMGMADQSIPIYGTPFWDKMTEKEKDWLRFNLQCHSICQFMHGEQGALIATAKIVGTVPDMNAKFYAATQVMDEARHVEAYDRYLREKVGLTFPISPYLRTLLDEILRESRWDMKYLGMQILVEGLALAAFGFLQQISKEPLIKQITKMIMQDEARHVAFGVMSLKGLYDDMPESELKDREDMIIQGSRLMRDRLLAQEVYACMGMPVAECVEFALHSPSMQLFRSMLFSKIVPNVKRLGLLTPRVRKGFEELGVIQYEDWDASA